MSLNGQAYIAGIHELPLRRADNQSTAQLHAEAALGALADAGLTLDDVDGYFCGADAPGLGGLTMAEYIGLNRHRIGRLRLFAACQPRGPGDCGGSLQCGPGDHGRPATGRRRRHQPGGH